MSIDSKFLKPESDPDLNAVDYWNRHHEWEECILDGKGIEWVELSLVTSKDQRVIGSIRDGLLHITGDGPLSVGKSYTKFMLLSRLKFDGNHRAAQTWIELKYLNHHIPYIRIGTDYFKKIQKMDRYGISRQTIKPWRKEEIRQDHGPKLIKHVTLLDDFCIIPDNTTHELVVNNCYNIYAPFSHTPKQGGSHPVTDMLMRHIFGDQVQMGYRYMKALYQHPDRPLPILCLVSKERQTGKTTFLNWMNMIFGDNFIQINPEDLNSQFNSQYATKNIIALDESVIDKAHAVEKLKSIATAKTMSVNQKHVQNYAIPFFGKIILATNKEVDFMKIDDAEIRFWVRKIPSIKSINTNIENDLMAEIPFMLDTLNGLPSLDFSRSRMLFTSDEIENDQLKLVKGESRTWLFKELMHIWEDYFMENPDASEFKATAMEIKTKWFDRNNQVNISFIKKVLVEDLGLKPADRTERYRNLIGNALESKPGRPYTITRNLVTDVTVQMVEDQTLPF